MSDLVTLEDLYFKDKLGCIMMGLEPLKVGDLIQEEDLYYAKDNDLFWIDGLTGEKVPHVTLLFGLMQSGQTWKPYVDKALEGWSLSTVEIDNVSYFDSPYETEPYYCLVAKLVVSSQLADANARLRKLPHIDYYPSYIPHSTIAYIKKNDSLRDEILYALNNRFAGKKIKTTELDYGR